MKRNQLLRLSAAVLFMGGLLSGLDSTAYDNTRWGAGYFPNVELTTQDGTKVHFYDDLIKGKMVVIELIYTRCVDACPLETARLAQVQRMLGDRVGKEIFFYSISIDPEQDTPKVLKEYAEKYHAGPGWLFLTGKKDDIDLISQKLGLYAPPNDRNRDGHTPAVVIGNEVTGQWMRNSATDNPRFLAILIGDWMNSWKNRQAETPKSYADASVLKIADKGQYIFATHCAACHTIGHGDKIGPDLRGVTSLRDRAWLARFIARPDQMIAEGDPVATELFKKYKQVNMPDLRLADEDIHALIDYMQNQTETAAPEPASGAHP
ncbi:MAG: SCO family protein [Acidobacteriia bacterium]|nr:SCO family protein [Terriglobia bacterium]